MTVEIETSFAYVNDVSVRALADAAVAELPEDAPPLVPSGANTPLASHSA